MSTKDTGPSVMPGLMASVARVREAMETLTVHGVISDAWGVGAPGAF